MPFPIQVTASLDVSEGAVSRTVTLNSGLSVILGANGAGKTHLLRALKEPLRQHAGGKYVRFLSAGRMGMIEQWRSDYDGHRGGRPDYEQASYGSKHDSSRRHLFETLTGDFHTLAERPDILVKIQERLRKLFKRELLLEWNAGNLQISFARSETNSRPYSSGREASGLLHLTGILAALYDDEVGVLLVDEPEVSLHPQLQAFLLKEFSAIAGGPERGMAKKIIVLATHSTEMLRLEKPLDLCDLIFCYDVKAPPVQIPPSAGELQSAKLKGLVSRLGQEHKLSLFSRSPLLVEGPSDVIVCTSLASRADIHLEAAGSQLLPVLGKGQMVTVSKLMRLLGKTPVVLADLDAFADGLEVVNQLLSSCVEADAEASRRGFGNARTMAQQVLSDFAAIVDRRWTEIEGLAPEIAQSEQGDSSEAVARRRRAMAGVLSAAAMDLAQLGSDGAWVRMRDRLIAVLDTLEASGIFVLRKGAIESYFLHEDPLTAAGKPAVAVLEAEALAADDLALLEQRYSDVYRCLRFAAQTESISESSAIRDLLLSTVAPLHARLKSGDLKSDPNVLARSILGDRSKLFTFSADGDSLRVELNSSVLMLEGFPLVLNANDNAIEKVQQSVRDAS